MGRLGFIRVRVGIIYDPFTHLRWNLLRKLFSTISRWLFLQKALTYVFNWSIRHFHWTLFYVLLVKILHLEKKHVISTSACFSLIFQEVWLIKRGWVGREGVRGICKNLHLREGVNKWKWRKWEAIFLRTWYCPLLHRVPSKDADYIFKELCNK